MKEIFLAVAWRIDEWAGWLTDPASGTVRYVAALAVFAAAAASPASRAWVMRSAMVARAIRAAALLALPLAAASLAVAWSYTATPSFLDHVEPQIAAVSWHLATGDPLWHAAGAPAFYALPYGPLTYEISYVALALFGPSLTAAKLAGPAALTATLAILWCVIRRAGAGGVAALAMWGALAVVLCRFGQTAYWNRPDPFIVLIVAAALWLHGRGAGPLRWTLIGALGGALFTLKIHAPAYILPIVAAELFAARTPVRAVAALALGAAAAVGLAFVPESADFEAFLFWVGVAVRHGGNAELFILNIAYAAVWLVPLCWLARRRWTALGRPERAMLATLAAVALVVLYPASKHGAGPWHFVPLVPVALYLALRIVGGAGAGQPVAAGMRGLAAYAVTVGALTLPAAIVAQVLVLRAMVGDDRDVAAHAELIAALDRHRGRSVAVGYAGTRLYPLSFLRPAAVYRGNPYLYDAAAFMDLTYATSGLRPPTIAPLAECRIDVWLIPAGQAPFSLRSVYDLKPTFPADIVAAFLGAYRRAAEGTYFDTWVCARR